MLIGRKLDIIHFGIFDYVAYKHVLEEKHQKFDIQLVKTKYIGYSKLGSVKGYCLYNTVT
jgi:hypothetical protein